MAVSMRRWQLRAAAMQLASAVRHMSAAAQPPPPGEPLPSLKAALRAIYKRVHPDLFQDHQPAKEANTRSFKMLHEYLDAARTGPKLPLPYRFHFYVRSDHAGPSSSTEGSSGASSSADGSSGASSSAAGSSGASGSGASSSAGSSGGPAPGQAPAPAGLREVVVTLPPPTRGAPGEAMSGSARKAFGSLLAALGLPSSFAGGQGEDAGAAADEFSRFVSLRDFLPQAVEEVHQRAAAQSSARHELGALRAALRLGRRLSAGFGGELASAGALVQLDLMQRLVTALESLPGGTDLAGLRVTIGGQASGVDALGTVWLAGEGGQEEWARHLAGVDAAHCRQRQELRQQVKDREAAVAAALGLAMVYTQPEASLGPDYRQALERLAAAAAERGPVGGGRFAGLPLMFVSPEEAAAGAGAAGAAGGGKGAELGGCRADYAAALLKAPTSATADQLYAAAERTGDQLVAAAGQRRRREEELAALRTQVERKIMLRRLLRHPSVSDSRYKSCLDRMLASAQKLSGLLHGQSVRVAEINGLSPDKSVIDIAWNWQI